MSTRPQCRIERLGIVLEPNGDPTECEGVLNPASARTRDGKLLLYPRMVAAGNISRIGVVEVHETSDGTEYRRCGFALEPTEAYELRTTPGGYGCEDPRVTFIAELDVYVMAYAAYGPLGPRIALAVSPDGYAWRRLGCMRFAAHLPQGANKDAVFFPAAVASPYGVPSLAFYHRPMSLTAPPIHPLDAADAILGLAPSQREGIHIGYIPLDNVQRDLAALCDVEESVHVISPDFRWGRLKIGAGTPPLRFAKNWFSLYHGVDIVINPQTREREVGYAVAAVLHDLHSPHLVHYLSPQPIWLPETAEELQGTVSNVVFPTAIDPDARDPAQFDVYYGMADARVGKARLTVI